MTPEPRTIPTEADAAPRNPYVGPVAFLEGQTLYGRERETDELADLLVSKRIVLLFAPSGAGKTSLIQAALIPRLRERYRIYALPTVRLTHQGDALPGRKGVNRYALSTMRSLERRYPREDQLPDAELAKLTLASYFAHRLASGDDAGKRQYSLLVLDQFEELFTLDPLDWDAKKAYLAELGNVLAGANEDSSQTEDGAPVKPWALISMREDRVAELQPFLDLIPTALAFRYRPDPLERDEALDSVMKPAGAYMTHEAAVRLVDDLRTMQMRMPDGTEVSHQGRFVEPVQLQVVCRRLWDKVVTNERRPIELGDVAAGGGTSEIDRALGDYFDTEVEKAATAAGVPQRNLRDWIESHLITANGIRAQALREPALLGTLNEAIGRLIDAHLVRSDVRNDREWIELAHDRLVDPIGVRNKAWRNRHLQLFQRQAKLWADAGKAHREMLFYREDLSDAERFASEHPDEINDDERQFLEQSRAERDQISQKRRKSWITFAALAAAVCIAAGAIYYQAEVKIRIANERTELARQQQDRTRLYQAVAAARDKPYVQAIGELLKVHDEIAGRPPDNLSSFFDNALLETLKTIPRSVESELGQHTHIVWSLAFKSDGSRLISGSWDGAISIWRLDRPGSPESTTGDQGAETYALAWHEPTGVLASTYINGQIILWRLTEAGLQRLCVLDSDRTGYKKQVTTAGFNHDGTLLATAGWDKTKIVLWDVSNPNTPVRIASIGSKYHQAPITQIAFLPADEKGERLMAADLDGKVGIWRIPAEPGRVSAEARLERSFAVSDVLSRDVGLYSAAASPNGRYLVAGDSEGYLYIWDLAADDPQKSGVRLTKAHHGTDDFNSQIHGIAFSPDGREFASAGVDGVVLRWTLPDAPMTVRDFKDKIDPFRIGQYGERLFSVVYHPSRAGVVAIGGTRAVRLIDMDKRGSLLATALVPGDQSRGSWRAVSMDRESSTIAAARGDKRILFWRRSTDDFVPVPNWTIDADRRTMFALHPKGSSFATIACGGKLTLWELVEGQAPVPNVLTPGTAPANSCPAATPSFSQDGALFAVALGSQLELWSRNASGIWERQFAGALDAGDIVASGAPDGSRESIAGLAFSAASDVVAAGGSRGRIRLLEIKNDKPASSFRPESVDAGKDVLALAFKPDGKVLVSGGAEGFITEWSLPVLKQKGVDTRHERSVTSLAFALRGNGSSTKRPILVSADRDGNVREWTSGTTDGPTVLLAPASNSPVRAMALRADGKFLVTAGDELLAWNFGREAMVQAAKRVTAKP